LFGLKEEHKMTEATSSAGATASSALSSSGNNSIMRSSLTIRQVICFGLGDVTFAVDISLVQEIIHIPDITRVPNTKSFVEGAINLRGKIVPVIDLRRRFKLDTHQDRTRRNRIIVLTVRSNPVGLIVDFVNQVLQIPDEALSPAPEMTITDENDKVIEAVATLNEELIILLNVDNLYSWEPEESRKHSAIPSKTTTSAATTTATPGKGNLLN